MTLEKDTRKRFFWRKSHSQQSVLSHSGGVDNASVSDTHQVSFEPDTGSTEFVESDVSLPSLFAPFIKNYVSNLSHHQSPTKLPYPPNFYYPASSLQHQMNLQMQHVDLLINANSLPTPQDRFLAVLKYTLSTCSLTKFPYKPIISFLGETAQSFTTHSDGVNTDTTFYCAEQLERDPTASAFYICNPTKGVVHEGNVALVPKFKQGHVHVSFVGQRKTILAHPQGLWNETYIGDVPDLNIRLLRMFTELGGTMNLTSNTGFAANVQFKDKPIFGGTKNAITGHITLQGRQIFTLEGTWDDVTYLVNSATHEKFEFLNFSTLPKLKVQTAPLDQQPITSGEREWGPLLDSLHRRDFEQAKVIKAQLDVAHHERLAKIDASGGFVPALFNKTLDGNYQIKDPNLVLASSGGHPTM
eukprot:Phypoly_transcript_08910.p1 GENE.Phypoly_transcript_08910~~Phypoly_transcript_08910.p1  ORF type:complete len:414 (+),score=48.49 Phypoly_transcript_08910:75-1316(+)